MSTHWTRLAGCESLVIGIALLVLATPALAARPTNPTCTINGTDPVLLTAGNAWSFDGTVSGGTAPYAVTWSYPGGDDGDSDRDGNPDSTTESVDGPTSTPLVSYAAAGTYTVTMSATDSQRKTGSCSDSITVNVTGGEPPPPPPPVDTGFAPQTDFKMLMNYELGMHCTGFEFAYCCVLPPYNSILAQVVKPGTSSFNPTGFPELLEADPTLGHDALNRPTVLRDKSLDADGNFNKYVLRYWHEAQPRNDGRGKVQGADRLISAVEGNSLLMWNTVYDVADDSAGPLTTGSYNGATGVVVGDPNDGPANESYANGWLNHLYIYVADGDSVPNLEGHGNTGLEAHKIRLGVDVPIAKDCGPSLQPMGPVTTDENGDTIPNDCAGFSNGNVLTWSGETGTVVYTQMKVLEDLPITLTSPRIWEALGLPLTPFEDTIDFFGDPGLVDEDSIRPYVAMKAQLHYYDSNDVAANDGDAVGVGLPVLDRSGDPVVGFGTAPIDIPNCERCHSSIGTTNSPHQGLDPVEPLVLAEMDFWNAYYDIDETAGDSTWYSRLKGAAISMIGLHDEQHGTSFMANYPGCTDSSNPSSDCGALPQNTRLGHESVICQKCHADNVIAVVKSGYGPDGALIKPVTEAIHVNHRGVSEFNAAGEPGVIAFSDSLGRSGGCQGCHPAHRSDGLMVDDDPADPDRYPITLDGDNAFATTDNRDAAGGCFVGRDVHSNPNKDIDGAETPEHLNAVGQWLSDNVFRDQSDHGASGKGIWCTNCHTQLSQEIWKAENMEDLVHGIGQNNVRAAATLADVANAIGVSEEQAIAWLDPTANDLHGTGLGDFTHAIWNPDPGLCDYVVQYASGGPIDPAHDATVATVQVSIGGNTCTNSNARIPVDCGPINGGPAFDICGNEDADGDFSVNILDFCTTPDCVAAAQAGLGDCNLAAGDNCAVPVPFSAATDGRDHWLAAGEPHCADCHAAPYVEQSGNINAFPPFNYPRKASLMRYSRGHQDITCQGCHESIHGLYPVTPPSFSSTGIAIDSTSYAQAGALNHDGSHGPLKCGTCHNVGADGIPSWVRTGLEYTDPNTGEVKQVAGDFDAAVSWMHSYTDEQSLLDSTCYNCHGEKDADPNDGKRWDLVGEGNTKWIQHAYRNRASRLAMDKVELEVQGFLSGDVSAGGSDPLQGVCQACHRDRSNRVSCASSKWKNHLITGRVAETVWASVTDDLLGPGANTCDW